MHNVRMQLGGLRGVPEADCEPAQAKFMETQPGPGSGRVMMP